MLQLQDSVWNFKFWIMTRDGKKRKNILPSEFRELKYRKLKNLRSVLNVNKIMFMCSQYQTHNVNFIFRCYFLFSFMYLPFYFWILNNCNDCLSLKYLSFWLGFTERSTSYFPCFRGSKVHFFLCVTELLVLM